MKVDTKIILETDRLVLRELDLNYTGFIVKLLNTPGWLEFIGDRNVRSEEQAKAYLSDGPLKSYRENGFGLYVVELKTRLRPIGMCGLLKRDYLEYPDIGFAFLPEFTKHGYALEIASATVRHAIHTLGIPKVMAIVMPGNKASVKLLERVGLTFLKNIIPPGLQELMLFSL